MISEQGTNELIAVYKRLYGVKLNPKQARELLKQLVGFVSVKHGKTWKKEL